MSFVLVNFTLFFPSTPPFIKTFLSVSFTLTCYGVSTTTMASSQLSTAHHKCFKLFSQSKCLFIVISKSINICINIAHHLCAGNTYVFYQV